MKNTFYFVKNLFALNLQFLSILWTVFFIVTFNNFMTHENVKHFKKFYNQLRSCGKTENFTKTKHLLYSLYVKVPSVLVKYCKINHKKEP